MGHALPDDSDIYMLILHDSGKSMKVLTTGVADTRVTIRVDPGEGPNNFEDLEKVRFSVRWKQGRRFENTKNFG